MIIGLIIGILILLACILWVIQGIKNEPTQCPRCEEKGFGYFVDKGKTCPNCGWKNEERK